MSELHEKESRANDEMDNILADAKKAAEEQQDSKIKEEMLRRQEEKLRNMGFATTTTVEEIDKKITELKDFVSTVKAEQDKLKDLITRAKAQGVALIPPQDPQKKTDKEINQEIYGDIQGL